MTGSPISPTACHDGLMTDTDGRTSRAEQWHFIRARLESLNVPHRLVAELQRKLMGSMSALLLYGSYARGDANVDSDLDLVVFDYSSMHPSGSGDVNISVRYLDSFASESGTLFGYHLKRDGVIVFDPSGRLADALTQIAPPAPGSVAQKIVRLSSVLDVTDADFREYSQGIVQVARYLLRSALYAEALDAGDPCFSVREIATRKGDADLAWLLSSHVQFPKGDLERLFVEIKNRLEIVVGELRPNGSGDLKGLVEDVWDSDRDLSYLATLVMSPDDTNIPYDEIPQVIL